MALLQSTINYLGNTTSFMEDESFALAYTSSFVA